MMIGRDKNLDFERSKKHKQLAENINRNQQDFWKKNHVQRNMRMSHKIFSNLTKVTLHRDIAKVR